MVSSLGKLVYSRAYRAAARKWRNAGCVAEVAKKRARAVAAKARADEANRRLQELQSELLDFEKEQQEDEQEENQHAAGAGVSRGEQHGRQGVAHHRAGGRERGGVRRRPRGRQRRERRGAYNEYELPLGFRRAHAGKNLKDGNWHPKRSCKANVLLQCKRLPVQWGKEDYV